MCRNISTLRTLTLILLLSIFAAACTPISQPGPEVVEIVRTERVPVPSWLTAECRVDCVIVTNGDLLECYQRQRAAIAECDARMGEIRGLTD